jgi:hypothetical protein
MFFSYYPLYHQASRTERQTSIVKLSPTAIFDAMLHMELPRHQRCMPSTYYALYHKARHAQQQITITPQSPTTAFEAMLDAELTSKIPKARTGTQHQAPALYLCFRCQKFDRRPYLCVRCHESDGVQINKQQMPDTRISEDENVQINLQRMPGAWISENENEQIALRRPPRICSGNNERSQSASQCTPERQTKRARENRRSIDRERCRRNQMLVEELDEQMGEWLRNTRAQKQMMEENEAAAPTSAAQVQPASLLQYPPASHVCMEEGAARRSDEHYIGWVDTPNLSPSDSECSPTPCITKDKRVPQKSDECYIGWTD